MIIGSINSLNYKSPTSWWNRLFKWYNKHQEVDYITQYKYCGVRLFHFRIKIDKNNHVIVGDSYPLVSLYKVLDYLDGMGDTTLLVTLDESFESYMFSDGHNVIENKFKETCDIFETLYKNIKLCGGYREFDRKKLYEFKSEKENGMPNIMKPNEWSSTYRFIQKWFPFLITKFNRSYIKRYDNFKGYLMLNYVNKR